MEFNLNWMEWKFGCARGPPAITPQQIKLHSAPASWIWIVVWFAAEPPFISLLDSISFHPKERKSWSWLVDWACLLCCGAVAGPPALNPQQINNHQSTHSTFVCSARSETAQLIHEFINFTHSFSWAANSNKQLISSILPILKEKNWMKLSLLLRRRCPFISFNQLCFAKRWLKRNGAGNLTVIIYFNSIYFILIQ